MPTFSLPGAPPVLTDRLQRDWNAPLPLYSVESEASAPCFMPENFRCRTARPVSYYALFK